MISQITRIQRFEHIREYAERNNCKLISSIDEYKNTASILRFTCSECGEIYTTSFDAFRSRHKNRCNSCVNKSKNIDRKLNFENVKNEIEKFGCKLLSNQYESNKDDLLLQCKCGETFTTTLIRFRKGQNKCSNCALSSIRIETYQNMKNYIETNSDCKLLTPISEYKNRYQEMDILCSCGDTFKTTFFRFKESKRQCDKCSLYHIDIDKVRKFIEVESDSGCKLISKKYTNERIPLKIKCKCGNEFITSLHFFKQGNRQCEDCRNRHSWDISKIQKWLDNNAKGYKVLSERYEATSGPLKFECSEHHLFNMTLNKFIQGNQRCPICNSSSGEQLLKYYLEKHQLSFKFQYRFKDCRRIYPLPFDFAIFEDKNHIKLKCLVEYHGGQHYKSVKYFGGDKNFEIRKMNDKIKYDYCSSNNIKLVIIPYWKIKNIDDVIIKEVIT